MLMRVPHTGKNRNFVMGIGEVKGELITLTRLGIKGLDELTPSQTKSGKRYN